MPMWQHFQIGANCTILITGIHVVTPLIAAAHQSYHEAVTVLIEAKAPFDRVNRLGWTVVTKAAVLGEANTDYQQTKAHLVNAGADLRIGKKSRGYPHHHPEMRVLRTLRSCCVKDGSKTPGSLTRLTRSWRRRLSLGHRRSALVRRR